MATTINEYCYCGHDAEHAVSVGGTRPGTAYRRCPLFPQGDEVHCGYFRFIDTPRTTCLCGLPMVLRLYKKTNKHYFRCSNDTEKFPSAPPGCGWSHWFNAPLLWTPTWTPAAQEAHNQQAENPSPKRKRDGDIRELMHPVPSLVDSMVKSVVPRARPTPPPPVVPMVEPSSDGGRHSLQLVVMQLVQDMALMRETVKRLESTRESQYA